MSDKDDEVVHDINVFPEFYPSTSKLSTESLENLVIAIMKLTDEQGLLVSINPYNLLQDWVLRMYPENIRKAWRRTKK
jgi:hypothetical protein